MLLIRPDRGRTIALGVASLAVVAGTVGLATHVHRLPASAPRVTDLGVVSTSGPSSSPSSGSVSPGAAASSTASPASPGLLGTHSTRLGSQSGGRTDPVRLRIAALPVTVAPRAVGLAADGHSLDLPPSARTAVWWAYGAAPGDAQGTVLLAGHISWAGRSGVLGRIGTLRPGNVIELRRRDGGRVRYVVTGRRQVPKRSLGQLGLFSRTGPARLVLVTCGGPYDAARHSFADNVVVQAVPSR